MSERVVVRISGEEMKAVRREADKGKVDLGTAADLLILRRGDGAADKSAGGNGKVKAETLDGELLKKVQEIGKVLEQTDDEALARIVTMGVSRHYALAGYAERGGAPKKPKAKKKPTKKKE